MIVDKRRIFSAVLQLSSFEYCRENLSVKFENSGNYLTVKLLSKPSTELCPTQTLKSPGSTTNLFWAL